MAGRNIKNKRGAIQDLVLIVVAMLFFSILIMFGFKLSNSLNNEFQASDLLPDESKLVSQQVVNVFPGVMDNSFLFVMFGLSAVAFVLASLVRFHPIFLTFFIFSWIIIILVSGAFSNFYQEMAANPEMVDIANQLFFTSIIMQALPFIVTIVGGVLAVIMYRSYQGQGV